MSWNRVEVGVKTTERLEKFDEFHHLITECSTKHLSTMNIQSSMGGGGKQLYNNW